MNDKTLKILQNLLELSESLVQNSTLSYDPTHSKYLNDSFLLLAELKTEHANETITINKREFESIADSCLPSYNSYEFYNKMKAKLFKDK